MDDLFVLEVRDQDLAVLSPAELAAWDQFESGPVTVFDLAEWLAARGVAFRMVSAPQFTWYG